MRRIDADAFIEKFAHVPMIQDAIKKAIDTMPTVDEVPAIHGKWLWFDGVRCSQCNYKLATTGLPSYCPNCGARMDGDSE